MQNRLTSCGCSSRSSPLRVARVFRLVVMSLVPLAGALQPLQVCTAGDFRVAVVTPVQPRPTAIAVSPPRRPADAEVLRYPNKAPTEELLCCYDPAHDGKCSITRYSHGVAEHHFLRPTGSVPAGQGVWSLFEPINVSELFRLGPAQPSEGKPLLRK